MPIKPRPVPTFGQLPRIVKHEWYRASGDCVCSICGKLYYDHPYFVEPYEWINILCDGDMVKL